MAKTGIKHSDVGGELSKTEWEGEETHELEKGDTLPESPSASQLFFKTDDNHLYLAVE
jgi:hypothetical protein